MEFSGNNFDNGSQVVPAMPTTSSGLEAVLTMLPRGDGTILQQPTLSGDILPLVMDSAANEPVPSFNRTPPSSELQGVDITGLNKVIQVLLSITSTNPTSSHNSQPSCSGIQRPAPPIPTMSPSYPISSMMFTPTTTSQVQMAGITTPTNTLHQPILATPTNHRKLAPAGTRIFIPQAPQQEDLYVT